MFKFHRKARLFPDETSLSQRMLNSVLLAKRRIFEFFGESSVPDLLYFLTISAVFFVGGFFFLPEGKMRLISIFSALLFTPLCLPFCLVAKKREIAKRDEAIYIEHLSYLYCRSGDFYRALSEVRSFYPKGRMRTVINESLDMLGHDISLETACRHIENHYDSMRIKILHSFICAYEDGRMSVIPVEVLSALGAYRKEEKRMGLEKYKDRSSICMVAGVSVIICAVIMAFLNRSGLISFEEGFDKLLFLMMLSFMLFFLAYEVLNLNEGAGPASKSHKTYVCADFLRCIMPLFLVKEVRNVLTGAVAFAPREVVRPLSRLAAGIDQGTAKSDSFVAFSDKFDSEGVRHVMEMLYSRSDAGVLSAAEISAFVRILNGVCEIHTREIEERIKRQRKDVILAPQAACILLLLGSLVPVMTAVTGVSV